MPVVPQVVQIKPIGLRRQRKASCCDFIAFSTVHATDPAHFLKLVERWIEARVSSGHAHSIPQHIYFSLC